jgi:Tol biopolymer transport system component
MASCTVARSKSVIRTLLLMGMLLGQACTGGGSSPAPTPYAKPSPITPPTSASGRIAFHSDPGGSDDLYVMNGDGSNLVQLTHGMEAGVPPVWSPDGTRIAFACCIPSFDRIYVVGLDGTAPAQVAETPGEVGTPAWSPDSTRIAYCSFDERRIFVVDADGSGRHKVISKGTDPSWSPDGSRLAFLSDRDGDLEVITAAVDGTDERQLTHNRAPDYEPAWSPDGTRILFVSERDGDSEIYVMRPDGSRQTNLSRSGVPDDFPAWSPDGTMVAYVSYENGADPHTIGAGNAEIYVVNVDGSGRRNLLMDPAWDGDPAWLPDGTHLAFTRRTGHGQLYVAGVSRHGVYQLAGVPGDANDCCAAWQP